MVVRALEAAREALYARVQPGVFNSGQPDPPTSGQQRADALALVAETALEHGLDAAPASERYQVVVHVDAPVLAHPVQPGQSALEDGVHVPAANTPRGWEVLEVPKPAAVPRDAPQALVAANQARGVAIDGWTSCPSWLGERLDLGWAIDVLHPAVNPHPSLATP